VNKKATETFCHSILQLEVGKSKALANLVMGLGSQTNAGSVTEISQSLCYHYQYSSITDCIDALYSDQKEPLNSESRVDRGEMEAALLSIKSAHYAQPFDKFYLLNTDSTPIIRPHSPTLEDESYVHVPNQRIKGNRPVNIGYDYTVIGLSGRRPLYNGKEAAWNLPLSVRRMTTDSVRGTTTAKQVNDLLNNPDTPLKGNLVVNALDRQYGTPEYIVDTYEQEDLINIIRLKNNRNVWEQLTPLEVENKRQANNDQRGANSVYGEQHSLKNADEWDKAPGESLCFGTQLSNGRKVIVEVCSWNDMLIRTKRGKNMKNKPMRLVSIRLLDIETGQPIYKRRMWLGLWGKRRAELDLEEIYWCYRNRFDIEHFFRFTKQQLLLDKYQTPDVEHLDNWVEIVNLTYWLLWVAKEEAKPCVYKWQKYDPYYKNRVKHQLSPSPSEVQRQLATIIWAFDQEPFIPKLKIISEGRRKGDTQPKRKRYKVVYKGKKKPKKRA
jgi:hypothetical protein